MDFTPQQAILELGDAFYDPVAAAPFPQAILRFRNDRAAAEVGLDGLSDAEWIAHFGRFEPLKGSLAAPLALRYHGHQFRVYNPEIGDGRGFLFAQMRDRGGHMGVVHMNSHIARIFHMSGMDRVIRQLDRQEAAQ